jgi:hypothetical protein
MSSVLSIYHKMGFFYHEVGTVEVEFQDIKDEMDWKCGTNRENISHRVLVGKRRQRLFVRPKRRW